MQDIWYASPKGVETHRLRTIALRAFFSEFLTNVVLYMKYCQLKFVCIWLVEYIWKMRNILKFYPDIPETKNSFSAWIW